MIICGIDPGTRSTGYGILDINATSTSGIRYIAHGAIKPASRDMNARVKEIFIALTDILKLYRPSEVAVETSFYALNAQTALKLGQIRGAIILAPTLMDIPVFEYTPTEIKKATCGYGHADKDQIHSMVNTILNLPKGTVKSRDASDALAIGLCHTSSRRFRRLAT